MNLEQLQLRFDITLNPEEKRFFDSIPQIDEIDLMFTDYEDIYIEQLKAWKIAFGEYLNQHRHDKQTLSRCLAIVTVCQETFEKCSEECSAENKEIKKVSYYLLLLLRQINQFSHSTAPNLPTLLSEGPFLHLVSYLDKFSIFSMSEVNQQWAKSVNKAGIMPTLNDKYEILTDEGANDHQVSGEVIYPHLFLLTDDLNEAHFFRFMSLWKARRGIINDLITAGNGNNWRSMVSLLSMMPAQGRIEFFRSLPLGDEINKHQELYLNESTDYEVLQPCNRALFLNRPNSPEQNKLIIYFTKKLADAINKWGFNDVDPQAAPSRIRDHERAAYLVEAVIVRHLSLENAFANQGLLWDRSPLPQVCRVRPDYYSGFSRVVNEVLRARAVIAEDEPVQQAAASTTQGPRFLRAKRSAPSYLDQNADTSGREIKRNFQG